MPRHIQEHQLITTNEENVDRLAQYLGIDTTGLDKDELVHVVFKRILFETTLAMNIDERIIIRDHRA